jgi:tetratricopeptide (TPR) repeat protein
MLGVLPDPPDNTEKVNAIRRKAVADYTSAIRRYPIPKAFAGRAFLYMELKDYRKALSDWNQAIKIQPTTAFYRFRAYTHDQLGHTELATADFETAENLRNAQK